MIEIHDNVEDVSTTCIEQNRVTEGLTIADSAPM